MHQATLEREKAGLTVSAYAEAHCDVLSVWLECLALVATCLALVATVIFSTVQNIAHLCCL